MYLRSGSEDSRTTKVVQALKSRLAPVFSSLGLEVRETHPVTGSADVIDEDYCNVRPVARLIMMMIMMRMVGVMMMMMILTHSVSFMP